MKFNHMIVNAWSHRLKEVQIKSNLWSMITKCPKYCHDWSSTAEAQFPTLQLSDHKKRETCHLIMISGGSKAARGFETVGVSARPRENGC